MDITFPVLAVFPVTLAVRWSDAMSDGLTPPFSVAINVFMFSSYIPPTAVQHLTLWYRLRQALRAHALVSKLMRRGFNNYSQCAAISQYPNKNVFSSRLNRWKLMAACRSSTGSERTCSCKTLISLMWQNADDDDLRRRPTDSRRLDRLEPCRTVTGRPGCVL